MSSPTPTPSHNENLMHANKEAAPATAVYTKQESMAHVGNPKYENISSDLPTATAAHFEEPPTYVTRLPATPHGIQLTRQTSVTKRKSAPCTPQETPDLTTPLGRVNNADAVESTAAADTPTEMTAVEKEKEANRLRRSHRRQGVYYTDGEYLFGPYVDGDEIAPENTLKIKAIPLMTVAQAPPPLSTSAKSQIEIEIRNGIDAVEPKAQTNKIEIAALEAKYGQIQQSIAEHLRQIDAYMANAKLALNRSLQQQQAEEQQTCNERLQQKPAEQHKNVTSINDIDAELWQIFAARHSPILVVESPLQAVLRQITRQAAKSPQMDDNDDDDGGDIVAKETAIASRYDASVINAVENMPIIEKALFDLSNIASCIIDCEAKRAQTAKDEAAAAAAGAGSGPPMELLTVKHTTAPIATTPTHVTILEDANTEEDDEVSIEESSSVDRQAVAKIDAKLASAATVTNKSAAVDGAMPPEQAEYKIEHVADVVANYEQLSATTKHRTECFKDNDVEPLPKLNIATARKFPAGRRMPPTAKVNAIDETATPMAGSKNVLSDFIASPSPSTARQSEEQLLGQVIDKFNENCNQKEQQTAIANLYQRYAQSPAQSQQQSATYNEKDVAILLQPQKNIISASTNATAASASVAAATHVDSNEECTQATPLQEACNNHMKHADKYADDDTDNVADEVEATADDIKDDDGDDNDDKQTHHAGEHGFVGFDNPNAVCCPVCGINAAKDTWGKLTLADQWRLESLHRNAVEPNDNFDTYKATYEIPSPYISRQISWEETLEKSTESTQKNEVQIAPELKAEQKTPNAASAPALITPVSSTMVSDKMQLATAPKFEKEKVEQKMEENEKAKVWQEQPHYIMREYIETDVEEPYMRALTPTQSFRRYPAPLLEPSIPPRSASPFGLNALDTGAMLPRARSVSPMAPTSPPPPPPRPRPRGDALESQAKYAFVPQVEGHNIGLLVRAATKPSDMHERSISPCYARPTQREATNTTTATNHAAYAVNTVTPNDVCADVALQNFNAIASYSNNSEIAAEVLTQMPAAFTTPTTTTTRTTTTTATTTTDTATTSTASAIADFAMHMERAHNRQSVEGSVEKLRSLSQPPPFEYMMQHNVPTAAATASSYTQQPHTSNIKRSVGGGGSNGGSLGNFIDLTQHNFTTFSASGHQQQQQQQESEQQQHAAATTHCSMSRECSVINRSFDNVSPRPYNTIEGYKRVAWPPASEERIVREFTPQPQSQSPTGQYYSQQPALQQQQQQQQPTQPQPQPFTQDQTDNPYQQQQQQQQQPQPLPHDYRGGSPGIITLRRETPVSQKPAPVYNAEPAAVSYQGGSKLRGDLKWPPPEYKEAAARENEERRQLALGPVCRPRKVNRDFTTFFAKNALNSYYPTYKVPPGTQHMLA